MGIISDFLKNRVTAPGAFLPGQQKELLEKYSSSLGLGKDQEAAKAFDTYSGSRIQSINNFSKIEIGEDTVGEILAADKKAGNPNAGITALKEAIAKALQQQNDTKNANIAFNEFMASIQTNVEDPDSDRSPKDWVSALQEAEIKAIEAIKTQHDAEKKALEQNITPQMLSAALDCTEDQAKKIKTDMIESLKKSQQKELAQFENSVKKSIIEIHKEQDRVTFLAALYESSSEMRAEIDRLAAENSKGKDSNVAVEYNSAEGLATFKGIKVEDLKIIKAITSGRDITKIPPGTFSMKLPNRWWAPLYSGGYTKGMKADLMTMAMAVKASGYSSITMSVSHKKDKDHAVELGRAAYAACRESGFPIEEIVIKVNGKVMSRDELFADAPSLLQAIDTRAASYDKERSTTKTPKTPTDHFKDEMQKGREAAPAPTAAPDSDTAGPKPA